jgi:hypothetical protein
LRNPFRASIASLALLALFASCDPNLGGGDPSTIVEEEHIIETDIPGGTRVSYYSASDVLLRYEDHFISDGHDIQVQYYSASGLLLYTYAYAWEDGQNVLIAYFDSQNRLSWYRAIEWAGPGLPSVIREYDAADILQWARRIEYGGGPEGDEEIMWVLYGPDLSVQSAVITVFDAESRPGMETSYQADEALLQASAVAPAAAARSLAAGPSTGATPRDIMALTLPVPPEMPLLALPNPDAMTIPVTGYRFWFYDAYGSTEVAFSADWFPLEAVRQDSRLGEAESASIEMEYYENGLPSRKRIYYGGVMALEASIEYDAIGFVTEVSTSGASLLLPLSYTLHYDDQHYVTRIDISSGDTLLQYFTYQYAGPVAPRSVSAARSFDPFSFLDDLLDANLTIRHYDGDNALVESFTVTALETGYGVRVDVNKPDGSLNGYYIVGYDEDGKRVSLSAHAANGTVTWSQSYGYAQYAGLFQAALEDAFQEAVVQYGRLSELYDLSGIEEMASAFMYDLLL